MKISRLTTHVVGTPWRDLTLVEVHTDEGVTGVGETRMLSHTQALLGYLAEAEQNHVLGSDPFDIESASRDVGCHERSVAPRAQPFYSRRPFELRAIRVQRHAADAGRRQSPRHAVRLPLRFNEDD